jgi:DNA-binding protein WhiA
MSFAAHTKKELTMHGGSADCCSRAELSALIRMNGSLQFGAGRLVLDVTTENAAIARRIYTLIKQACFRSHCRTAWFAKRCG